MKGRRIEIRTEGDVTVSADDVGRDKIINSGGNSDGSNDSTADIVDPTSDEEKEHRCDRQRCEKDECSCSKNDGNNRSNSGGSIIATLSDVLLKWVASAPILIKIAEWFGLSFK